MRIVSFIAAMIACAPLATFAVAAENVDGAPGEGASSFVTAHDGKFYCHGKPYYYIGTNYWYGPLLASPGATGDRERLAKELDFLAAHGLKNLRILAGAEGPDDQPYRVTPGLQISPGKYNQDLLTGLDYLLAELGKRDMKAVLYVNNTWEWSGGYAQYVNWSGGGEIPYPLAKSWPEFMKFAGKFHDCPECIEAYFNHVRFLLGRTNQVTGVKYVDDPTIMAWQIANEPRAVSAEHIPAFEKWMKEAGAVFKSLDHNHLLSTGNEGSRGCEGKIDLYERLHADPNIDYCTIHIWPKNWRWLDVKDMPGSIDKCITNTNEQHCAVARKLDKPLVIEEYGFPRDGHVYAPESTTASRDRYYENIFAAIVRSHQAGDVLAGCNFWTFGGFGRATPGHTFWAKGDALLGDPPQEEQGLNSVFDTDMTIAVVDKFNRDLSMIGRSK
jgi:mannan endo-1,4-beta-mannosidase